MTDLTEKTTALDIKKMPTNHCQHFCYFEIVFPNSMESTKVHNAGTNHASPCE